MWSLINRTPFAADRCFLRDSRGAEVFIVVVKATLAVTPGGALRLAAAQEPVLNAPQYTGTPGASSLYLGHDFVLDKSATDILVHGHAYAANGQRVRELLAELRVGDLCKAIHVSGERRWTPGRKAWRLSDPEPFLRVPLGHEYAFGGGASDDHGQRHEDPRNPVGRGFMLAAEPIEDTPAPQLEYPDDRLSHWRQSIRPLGLGPVAPGWSPRRELAGTFDDRWRRERAPLPPQDADPRHAQTAPADQQCDLHGGELVQLRNLSASGLLRFTLPRVDLRLRSLFGTTSVEHRPRLHTVVIEPDLARLMLVWHSALPCHTTLYSLTDTLVEVESTDLVIPPPPEDHDAEG